MKRAFSCYLDLVRFLAAALVVIDHSVAYRIVSPSVAQWLPQWGREAVVTFFVLSGFVIAHAAQSRQQSLAQYAAARAARLYSVALPALALAFGAACLAQVHLAEPMNDAYQVQKWFLYLPFHALYLGELWRFSETPVWLGAYWSLGYEAWYYAFFGALYFLRGRVRLVSLALILLAMGYKLWLLLPVWYAGVLLWRWQARWPISAGLARAGMLLAPVLLLLYAHWQGEMVLRALAVAYWPWPAWPLGSADRVLGDYLVGLLILLNFYCALHARLSTPDWLVQLGRVLAFYTFPLYLAHSLVISAWTALRPSAQGGSEELPFIVAIVLVTWLFGQVSRPLRSALEHALLALWQALCEAGGGVRSWLGK